MHKVRPFLFIDFNEIEKCRPKLCALRRQTYIESVFVLCFVVMRHATRNLLEPDHDAATVVALTVQIMAALTLILTIQCKGDLTDMLEEKISSGQAEICWFGREKEFERPHLSAINGRRDALSIDRQYPCHPIPMENTCINEELS